MRKKIIISVVQYSNFDNFLFCYLNCISSFVKWKYCIQEILLNTTVVCANKRVLSKNFSKMFCVEDNTISNLA